MFWKKSVLPHVAVKPIVRQEIFYMQLCKFELHKKIRITLALNNLNNLNTYASKRGTDTENDPILHGEHII